MQAQIRPLQEHPLVLWHAVETPGGVHSTAGHQLHHFVSLQLSLSPPFPLG